MINKKIKLKKIQYQTCDISNDLIESIDQRGIIIPIKVEVIGDDEYRCVDGHKRCTACAILEERNQCEMDVFCMLVNDFSKSGSNYWGARNHH